MGWPDSKKAKGKDVMYDIIDTSYSKPFNKELMYSFGLLYSNLVYFTLGAQ